MLAQQITMRLLTKQVTLYTYQKHYHTGLALSFNMLNKRSYRVIGFIGIIVAVSLEVAEVKSSELLVI